MSCVDGEVRSVVTAGDVSVDKICVLDDGDDETEDDGEDSVDVGVEVIGTLDLTMSLLM